MYEEWLISCLVVEIRKDGTTFTRAEHPKDFPPGTGSLAVRDQSILSEAQIQRIMRHSRFDQEEEVQSTWYRVNRFLGLFFGLTTPAFAAATERQRLRDHGLVSTFQPTATWDDLDSNKIW